MITNYKTWWAGDPRVEPYMRKVRDALDRSHKGTQDERTDIYNRCYEAVYQAIIDCDKKASIRNVLKQYESEGERD